uniref:Uncharacterized protein n=1 Tax=mine drainage metagenome TaxID=410659 RepID=E6PKX3_9ZZZZ
MWQSRTAMADSAGLLFGTVLEHCRWTVSGGLETALMGCRSMHAGASGERHRAHQRFIDCSFSVFEKTFAPEMPVTRSGWRRSQQKSSQGGD